MMRIEMSGRRLLLAIVLMLALPLLAAAQSRVFYDGAEAPAAWDVNKCTAVAVAADGGAPFAGGKMWRCGWNGTVDWTHPDKLKDMAITVGYDREFLVRFKRRYDANVDWQLGSKEWRVSYGSTGEVFGACQREKGAAAADLLAGGGIVSTYWGGGPPCGVGWKEIALYRKDAVNNTGGVTRLWQDGARLKEWTGNTGGHAGNANFPSNWSSNEGWGHDGLNYIYFDEVEIFSDRAGGTPITGRLEDNTARVSGVPPPPPPGPVKCEGTWVETLSAPTPAVCDATRVQTRTLTRTWVTSREPANGGTECPVPSVVTSTVSEPCDYVPPPPPPPLPVPTMVGRFASQATYTSGGVSGLRVTLRVPASQALPVIGRLVSLRVPLVAGFEDRQGRVRSTKANAYAGGDGQVVVELPGMQAIGLQFALP